MNAVQVFESAGQSLRVVEIGNEPWFVAADVCRALGISRTDDGVGRLDDDEKGAASIRTPGGAQEMRVVSEAGLYTLIMGSRKQEAKAFRRWVTHDVLPAIRKTGGYHTRPGGAIETENDPNRLRAFAGLLVRKASLLEQLRDVEAAMAEGGAEAQPQPQRPPVTSRHRDIIERIREIARPREQTSTTEVVALLGVERTREIEMLVAELLRDEGFRRHQEMRHGKKEWLYVRR